MKDILKKWINRFLRSPHPNLKELKDDIKIIFLRPIMLLLKIPADMFDRMYKKIPGYLSKLMEALAKALTLPFNIFIGISFSFKEESIQQKAYQFISGIFHRIGGSFGGRSSRKTIAGQLKIFLEVVSSQLAIDSSFAKDYTYAWWFAFAAFLLQFVSFFTTLSGTSVFFQGIADVAPLFVAIVIQMGMFLFARQAFEYGARTYLKILLAVAFICSMLTSYTGLVVMNHSPENQYWLALHEYQKTFEKAKLDAQNKLSDASAMANTLVSRFHEVENNGTALEQIVKDLNNAVDSEPSQKLYEQTRRPDGTVDARWTGNTNYNDQMNQWYVRNQNRAFVSNGFRNIERFVKDNKKQWRDLTSDPSLDALSEAIQEMVKGHDTNKADKLERFMTDLNDAIVLNNKVAKKTQLPKIGKINLKLMDQIKQRELISEIKFDEIVDDDIDIPGEKISDGLYYEITQKLHTFLGYELENGLVNIEEKRTKIQNAVENNYIAIAVYLDDAGKAELAAAKKRVDELPGSFVYAFAMWASTDTRGNAFFNFIFALIPDSMTMMFSFAAAKKHASFLYVHSSKDYYTDTDELFRMVFRSMQSNELFRISKDVYQGMEDEEFRLHCLEYVSNLHSYISKFLKKFELSESTITEGFDLCWKYTDHHEIKVYQPIISALIKSNLAKVIPYASFEQLEYDFLLGMEFLNPPNRAITLDNMHELKNKLDNARKNGYVVLLKSKGENFCGRISVIRLS